MVTTIADKRRRAGYSRDGQCFYPLTAPRWQAAMLVRATDEPGSGSDPFGSQASGPGLS